MDWGDVLVYLGDGAEADLVEDEDQRLGGEGFVPAFSLRFRRRSRCGFWRRTAIRVAVTAPTFPNAIAPNTPRPYEDNWTRFAQTRTPRCVHL